jgi:hypothetical protein
MRLPTGSPRSCDDARLSATIEPARTKTLVCVVHRPSSWDQATVLWAKGKITQGKGFRPESRCVLGIIEEIESCLVTPGFNDHDRGGDGVFGCQRHLLQHLCLAVLLVTRHPQTKDPLRRQDSPAHQRSKGREHLFRLTDPKGEIQRRIFNRQGGYIRQTCGEIKVNTSGCLYKKPIATRGDKKRDRQVSAPTLIFVLFVDQCIDLLAPLVKGVEPFPETKESLLRRCLPRVGYPQRLDPTHQAAQRKWSCFGKQDNAVNPLNRKWMASTLAAALRAQ